MSPTASTRDKDERLAQVAAPEQLHQSLLADTQRVLEEIAAGRVEDADTAGSVVTPLSIRHHRQLSFDFTKIWNANA